MKPSPSLVNSPHRPPSLDYPASTPPHSIVLPTADATSSSSSNNKSHRVVFVLGGPGAGGRELSANAVNTYKCVHLSVSELMRRGSEDDTYAQAVLIRPTLIAGNTVLVELTLGPLRTVMYDTAASSSASSLLPMRRRRTGTDRGYSSSMAFHGFMTMFGDEWHACQTVPRSLGRQYTIVP